MKLQALFLRGVYIPKVKLSQRRIYQRYPQPMNVAGLIFLCLMRLAILLNLYYNPIRLISSGF
jgi:hypothetical protein